jgi:2-polyprenyl-3-methyl-5-hydroxy-6-metoxy-1,4-benzoquinol methylase
VLSLDTNPLLVEWTHRVAQKRAWKLQACTDDLAESPGKASWGQFDAVISFSVLEHISKDRQQVVLARLAELLNPGGVFALTFDYGAEAPAAGAIRDPGEIERLVEATGLSYLDGQPFRETEERFVLDNRYPNCRYTFGAVFLRKPE